MTRTGLTRKMNFSFNFLTGRLFCSFLLLVLFCCHANLLLAQTPVSAQNTVPMTVKVEDVDGDGLKDASLETRLLRVILSSRTGSPSVYYLKGASFEENLYPPVIQDLGYNIPAENLRPFLSELVSQPLNASGYTVEVEEQTAEAVVIRATANVSLAEANASASQGLSLTKRFTFHENAYHFNVEHIVSNLRDQLVSVGNDESGSLAMSFGPGVFLDPYGPMSLLGLKPGAVEKFSDVKDFNGKGAVAGAYNGVGLRDQYFCVLLEADESARVGATAYEVSSTDQRHKPHKGFNISCVVPKFNLGARETRTFKFRVYAGPMILDQQIGRASCRERV